MNSMDRIRTIFFMILLVTVGTYTMLWAISPKAEHDRVMATQGIRLVGSTVVRQPNQPDKDLTIKIGTLFLGDSEKIFRVNEIRKSQSNEIYLIVSQKIITDYVSYEEYLTEPFSKYQTYKLEAFVVNKSIIGDDELFKFYTKYADTLNTNRQNSSNPLIYQLEAKQILKTTDSMPEAYSTTEISNPEVERSK